MTELACTCPECEGLKPPAPGEITRLRAENEELVAALRDMIDLATYWINRDAKRGMGREEYDTWRTLGHQSNAMRAARAIIAPISTGKKPPY